jgi:hypothetical protein
VTEKAINPASQSGAVSKILIELYAQPGVSGVCLQKGRSIIKHDLPFSDDRISNFAARVDHLVGGYEVVGRNIWQICAGFEKYWLLILSHGELRLSLLLKPDSDTSLVSSRAAHLLMQLDIPDKAEATPAAPAVPPPVASTNGNHPPVSKEKFVKLLSGLLGRVTGSAQASRLISREMAKYQDKTGFSVNEAREIGLTVLEFIPNRGKRTTLTSEFLNALNQ